jgi:hypothetical protein
MLWLAKGSGRSASRRNRQACRLLRVEAVRAALDQRAGRSAPEQPWRERAQHAFNRTENERGLKAALRELAEVRYELARRDRSETFARAPSPSTSLH